MLNLFSYFSGKCYYSHVSLCLAADCLGFYNCPDVGSTPVFYGCDEGEFQQGTTCEFSQAISLLLGPLKLFQLNSVKLKQKPFRNPSTLQPIYLELFLTSEIIFVSLRTNQKVNLLQSFDCPL